MSNFNYQKFRSLDSFARQCYLEDQEQDDAGTDKDNCEKCGKEVLIKDFEQRRIDNFTWRLCIDCAERYDEPEQYGKF